MPRIIPSGLVLAVLVAATSSGRADDAWSKTIAKRGIDPSLVANPIAITPEIRSAAATFSGWRGGSVEELQRIQNALFDATRFTFDYDATLTYTAAEALAARRGNCIAFTNLFIALARARGFPVRAGTMTPRGIAEKRGDLVYVTNHVVAVYPRNARLTVFDFNRTRNEASAPIRLLDDFELAALYVNNRAVEALTRGEYDSAEARFTAALKLAPEFAGAAGNLGVLRRRRGDIPGALDAYRRALALEPHNPSILGNLAALYASLGLEREATAALRLADLSVATPYTILARGDLEAADGRYDSALRFFRRAARLDPRIPEPQLAIARLAGARGRLDEARRAALRVLSLDPGNAEAAKILDDLAVRPTR